MSVRPKWLACCVALSLLPLGLAGCGPADGVKDSVSGKVTLNGQPVSGELVFIGSDGKQIASPLGVDGGYKINNPPKGQARFLVKARAAPVTQPPKDGPPLPALSGATPPAKYAQSNNGLSFEVKGGRQTYDIPLTP